MRSVMWVEKNSEAAKIMLRHFPEYSGKKFAVVINDSPVDLRSYWDSGSRTFFSIGDWSGKIMPVPQNGTPFDQTITNTSFPNETTFVVSHEIHSGKDLGLALYVHPHNMNPSLLPAEESPLSNDEKLALSIIRTYLPAYRRLYAARKGITDWDVVMQSLQQKKLVNSRGAITLSGKNAAINL